LIGHGQASDGARLAFVKEDFVFFVFFVATVFVTFVATVYSRVSSAAGNVRDRPGESASSDAPTPAPFFRRVPIS
jgi:hypothetical protein